MRRIAVPGCFCRSLQSAILLLPDLFSYVYVPRLTKIAVHFVLLHGARTTAQIQKATVHRDCLPPAYYSTTLLLPSINSSGHTLRVWMIVLRLLKSIHRRFSTDHLTTPPPHQQHLSPCCFLLRIDVCGQTLPLPQLCSAQFAIKSSQRTRATWQC